MHIGSRSLLVIAALSATCGVACGSGAKATLTIGAAGGTQRLTLDAWLGAHPLAADQNIRADLAAQTPAASAHVVQVRDREAPHRHAEHDLTVTLLRGEGAIFVDAVPHAMQTGDAVVIPRGVAHFFVNLGSEPAVAFVTFAPPFDGKDQVPVGR